MIEEWRKIPGLENSSVSSLGRVRFDGSSGLQTDDVLGRSYTRSYKPRMRKIHTSPKRRYPFVSFSEGGKRHNFELHRLVALAFLGPLPKGGQTRHLDGDTRNNRIDNLAYGTVAENAADRDLHGTALRGEDCPWAKLDEAGVREIRRRVAAGEVQRRLAEEFGVAPMAISRAVRGERWGHIA